MMKRYMLLPITLCCLALMASCGTQPSKNEAKEPAEKTQTRPLVGNDKDDHGCIASAGYQWSELLKDCIRPFEKGIRLEAVSEDKSLAAYLVLNNDSTQIEVFLPKMKKHPILTRTSVVADESIWTSETDKMLSVKSTKGSWSVYQNNQPIYTVAAEK